MQLVTISEHQSFQGKQYFFSHESNVTHARMRFGLFLPEVKSDQPLPLLFLLAGLTCTEETIAIKGGIQRIASHSGIAIVTPDTSPPLLGIPAEAVDWDFGRGASFYINATQTPWQAHYQMYSYLTTELPDLLHQHFPLDRSRVGISGHSMGGHGALMLALKNPNYFKTVSAFAPICSPTSCPWGIKAFTGYLGADEKTWEAYDSCYLVRKHGWQGPTILIDQGTKDPWLDTQLKPELLTVAAFDANVNVNLRMRNGFDHSYYFVASFMEEHIKHHANYLKA